MLFAREHDIMDGISTRTV
ncbi:Protein of unknown function [Thermobacillus xylanilyticus]|uniref:Uncharacterized protein n=1 Tax=Thermobacillus xylanilyticus TaxID=76633 RepID=A0ABN7S8X4_THEXY|nr:Protein of unknown function [Thermobacillus xylanilyticus]